MDRKHISHILHASAAAAALTVTASRVAAVDVTQSATFVTSNQSLFGTGNAANEPFGVTANLLNIPAQNLNFGIGVGGVADVTLNGTAQANANISLTGALLTGSVGASLPYNVTLELPSYTAFSQNGFIVGIGCATYASQAATLSTSSPSLQFQAGLNFSGSATLGGSASATFFGNTYGGSFGPNTLFNTSQNFTLLSYNSSATGQPDGTVQLLPVFFNELNLGKLFNRAAATGKLLNKLSRANTQKRLTAVTLKALSFGYEFKTQDLFTTSFSLPDIQMANPVASNTSISSNGSGQFAQVGISLTALMAKIIPQFPPLAASASVDFTAGEASISAEALNVQAQATLNLTQTDTVTPTATTVGFNFGQMVSVRVIKSGCTTPGAYQTVNSVSGLAPGDQLQFQNALAANSNLNLTPIYTTSANLQSQFGLSLTASIPVTALSGQFSAEIFGLSGCASFGPVVDQNIVLGNVALGTLYNQTFALAGFSTVTGGTITLSTQAYEWNTDADGDAITGSGNLFDQTNYSTSGTTPPSGQDVDISNGSGTRLVVNDNADPKANGDNTIGTLSLQGNVEVDVPANRTLQLNSNLELGVNPGTNGLVLQGNKSILNMANTTNAIIDAGQGIISLANAGAQIQTAADLTFLSGNISGQGTIQVTGDLMMGSALFLCTTGSLSITANSITYENNGGVAGRLEAAAGSALTVTTAANNGISGQADGDRIEIQADNGATITLNISSLTSAHITAGTGGNGSVQLAQSMALTDILNDGVLTTANNIQLVTAGGTLTNNGSFTITTGSSLSTLLPLELAGTGVLNLQGGSLSGANGSSLINDVGHTIQLSADGASLGTDSTGNGPTVTNNGVIEAALTAAGTVNLNAASATGSFINNGEIHEINCTLTLATGSFDNQGTYVAGQVRINADGSTTFLPGNLTMTNSTLENLSAASSTLTLTDGLYVLATGSSTMALKGPAASGTDFVNDAGIQLLGTTGGKSGLTINGTDLSDMNSFTNDTIGMLMLGPGRSFVTKNFINNGALLIMGNPTTPTIFGNVTNNAGATIMVIPTAAGSLATLQLHTTSGVATNNGDIDVDQSGITGDVTVTVTGDTGNASFTNAGTVEVHNSSLVFANITLNHGGGGQFQGGTWIVDSSSLTLNLDAAPSILNADLTMIGASSRVNFNGGVAFENTINFIGEDGELTLDTRDMTFSNALSNAGTITLANGSTLTAPSLFNESVITGFGSLNATVTNDAQLVAFGGQLTLLKNVDNSNGTIIAQAADTTNEISAGGIALDQNPTLTGGQIQVQSGGALWGYGNIQGATITNNGAIIASDFYRSLQLGGIVNHFALNIDITPGAGGSLTNNGLIIADADQIMNILSQTPNAPLNNAGTPANGDTPASPGYLIVQYEQSLEPPFEPANGHLVLQNVQVLGGVLQVRGDMVDSNSNTLPEDQQATVDGVNSALNLVTIDVNEGLIRDVVAGSQFVITPAAGTTAQVLGSTILADNGALVTLSGATIPQVWNLAGSTLLARNANSQIVLSQAFLTGGILQTQTGGQIVFNDAAWFQHVINQATLTLPQGKLLTLSDTFYNVQGSLTVNGTVTLDGTTPIGGPGNIDSGSDFLGGTLTLNPNSNLQVIDEARIIGTNFTNNGTITLNDGQSLWVTHSTDNTTTAPAWTNAGNINVNNNGFLYVVNPTMSNSGNVDLEGGTITAPTYEQTAGSTIINGTIVANANLKGGIFSGVGKITGNLDQTGGTLNPGDAPGTITVGSYTLNSGLLHIQIVSLSDFSQVAATSGNISLASPGDINLDLSEVDPNDPLYQQQIIGFQIFTITSPATITDLGVDWTLTDPGPFHFDHFDSTTGIAYLSQATPEPASLLVLTIGGALLTTRRRKR